MSYKWNTIEMSETEDITELQTVCPHCDSKFRITPEILQVAIGQVRCSQCGAVFNALMHMPTGERKTSNSITNQDTASALFSEQKEPGAHVSLSEAMYGSDVDNKNHFNYGWWFVGTFFLICILLVQVLYYQRTNLILNPDYQQSIQDLCQYLPCANESYSSIDQIKLVDRNVYTHPTQTKALMINGSFKNEAPFRQPAPKLLISLSDRLGNLISKRRFDASQYLQTPDIRTIKSGETIRFHLEVVDPGAEALTYEFEFF